MSKIEYTPGPWRVSPIQEKPNNLQGCTILAGKRGKDLWGIAQIQWYTENSNDKLVQQANANLILTAPEVLEALEILAERVLSNMYVKKEAVEALELIKKARGEL